MSVTFIMKVKRGAKSMLCKFGHVDPCFCLEPRQGKPVIVMAPNYAKDRKGTIERLKRNYMQTGNYKSLIVIAEVRCAGLKDLSNSENNLPEDYRYGDVGRHPKSKDALLFYHITEHGYCKAIIVPFKRIKDKIEFSKEVNIKSPFDDRGMFSKKNLWG